MDDVSNRVYSLYPQLSTYSILLTLSYSLPTRRLVALFKPFLLYLQMFIFGYNPTKWKHVCKTTLLSQWSKATKRMLSFSSLCFQFFNFSISCSPKFFIQNSLMVKNCPRGQNFSSYKLWRNSKNLLHRSNKLLKLSELRQTKIFLPWEIFQHKIFVKFLLRVVVWKLALWSNSLLFLFPSPS